MAHFIYFWYLFSSKAEILKKKINYEDSKFFIFFFTEKDSNLFGDEIQTEK